MSRIKPVIHGKFILSEDTFGDSYTKENYRFEFSCLRRARLTIFGDMVIFWFINNFEKFKSKNLLAL
jgi:hypothetical protein